MKPLYSTNLTENSYLQKFIDRETGQEKQFIIQNSPSSNVVLSPSSLSVTTELNKLSPGSFIALLKCWLILQQLQNLPEKALKEASEELEGILNFYSDYSPQTTTKRLNSQVIKATIMPPKIRPPIVLDS